MLNGGNRYVYNVRGGRTGGNSNGIPNEAENTPHVVNTYDDIIVSKVEENGSGVIFNRG